MRTNLDCNLLSIDEQPKNLIDNTTKNKRFYIKTINREFDNNTSLLIYDNLSKCEIMRTISEIFLNFEMLEHFNTKDIKILHFLMSDYQQLIEKKKIKKIKQ